MFRKGADYCHNALKPVENKANECCLLHKQLQRVASLEGQVGAVIIVRIAGCQPHEVLGDVHANLRSIVEFSRQAEQAGARLMCFPECFLQGYIVDVDMTPSLAMSCDSADFAEVLDCLSAVKPVLVFGFIEEADGRLFNSAAVVNRGELLGCYRKKALLRREAQVFAEGDVTPVFDVDGVRFGVNICKDLNSPEYASVVASQGAILLVCPCNNMLATEAAWEWKDKHNKIRAERCVETSLWLLSSDVTGDRDGRISFGPTAVISPAGEVVAQAPLETTGMVLFDLPLTNKM